MGTCRLEGKPCSEYRQNIHPSKTMLRISTLEYLHPGRKPDIKWISTSYPPWISNEPEIEYFPSVMFYFPTTPVLIEGWSKHWNLGAIRPPVNCIESVSEVSQDNPLRLLQSCVHTCPCVIVCIWAPRAQNSIPPPCSNSIMCTKQFVMNTPLTLSRAFFAPQDLIESLYFQLESTAGASQPQSVPQISERRSR